jgi:hypothetical protein
MPMEPRDEILKLLEEIRDNQRELLAFQRQWKAESDQRYQKWETDREKWGAETEKGREEFNAWLAKYTENQSLWKKSNEVYLRSHQDWARRQKAAEKLALIFLTVFLSVIGIGAVLAVLGWIS